MGVAQLLAGERMRKKLKLSDRHFQVDLIAKTPLQVEITEGDETRQITLNQSIASGSGRIKIDDRTAPYFVTEANDGVWVTIGGETLFFEKSRGADREDDHHAGFTAPMPGKVIKVSTNEGDLVEKGQVLVIMEAMKMEHRIEAPSKGIVTALHAQEGQVVDQGFSLLDFEPEST